MEQWERELRDKLKEELPNDHYSIINNGKMIIGTGKLGYIDLQVAIQKRLRSSNIVIKDEN